MTVSVPAKASVDMTWYTGSVLGPLERAENLVASFTGEEASVAQLITNSGLSEQEIFDLVPLMVRHGLVQPLTEPAEVMREPDQRGKIVLRLGTAAQRQPVAL